jgi:carbon storage regulator
MLVLTRKQQQQIKIGDEIVVTILRVKGNTVRVGIEAPRSVRVVRGELPPEGQTEPADADAPAESLTVLEGVVRVGDGEDSPVEKRGLRVASATEERGTSDLPRPASHLPQRRVLNRAGAAPLRVVMSGAVLAK